MVAIALLAMWLGVSASSHAAEPLGDLPIVAHLVAPTDATAEHGLFVVLFSGDGGWSTLTRQLTVSLNAAGYSVVGWNTLRYFWHAKTPEQAAADLDRVIDFYAERLKVRRVILTGYSMGADVLPAIAQRLPPAALAKVQSVVLLAPGRATTFEFHLSGWLNRVPKGAQPIKPDVVRLLEHTAVVCVYGADEADKSLCTELADTTASRIELPGAHHFDGNYGQLAELILHGKAVT